MRIKLILLTLSLSTCLGVCMGQNVPAKGNVTQIMNGGRILDCKEIQASDLPYTKGIGAPFSIFLVPKSSTNTTEVEIAEGRLYQGNVVGTVPLVINSWNVTAFVLLTVANTSLFTNYRVFVGYGQTAE